ncbi:hypothetical protein ScPMuIL_007098 [Solemya velum]
MRGGWVVGPGYPIPQATPYTHKATALVFSNHLNPGEMQTYKVFTNARSIWCAVGSGSNVCHIRWSSCGEHQSDEFRSHTDVLQRKRGKTIMEIFLLITTDPGKGKKGRGQALTHFVQIRGEVLYGLHPVEMAIEAQRRVLHHLFVKEHIYTDPVKRLLDRASALDIPQ